MRKNALLWQRARVIKAIRDFFWERGFLEVETPLLIPANAPEEHIDPVGVHSRYLHTSPELCMKRLLCRGYGSIFQICHCWRDGERGGLHLPEFTMLEWYRSDCDYQQLMSDCRDLLQYLVSVCLPDSPVFRHKAYTIDPYAPWVTKTVEDAFRGHAHTDVWDCLEKGLYEEILTERVEPALAGYGAPVILRDYPEQLAALSRTMPDNPMLAERFELYLGGVELANGFSELNDPVEQRKRFEQANFQRRAAGLSPLPLPEPFLKELADMPPASGIALGVDRLVMLMTGSDSINDVVAFVPEEL